MMIVSTGYVYRVLAGGLAVDLAPSPWILMTIFLASIFMVAFKRLSDLYGLEDAASVRKSFEAYNKEYLLIIAGVSASSAVVSYMLFTLSTYAQDTFSNQYLPVTSVFIIYAVFRYTQIALQSPLAGDPIKLILRDTHLMTCIGLCAAFISITNSFEAGS
jgi:4-hydroxybenzoate polyprenyltransferase